MAALLLLLSAALTGLVALGSLLLFGVALLGHWPPGAPLWGPARAWPAALGVDLALWALFGLQHSGMARRRFKDRLGRSLPAGFERMLYVLASTIALLALIYLWQPIAGTVWSLPWPLTPLLDAVGFVGMVVVTVAALTIDGLDLIGLRTPLRALQGRPDPQPRFLTPFLYRIVRHPIQLGVLMLLWCRGEMSVDRLVMAFCGSVYVLVALPLEERDLVAEHGEAYRRYQERVPRLIPRLRRPQPPH